jgi:CHAD domain-containing protein
MTRQADYVEREIKFKAELNFELPDLREVVGSTKRLPEQSLRTAYFDTRDLRLWQRGITLRFRTGEDVHTGKWTLKLPEDESGQSVDRTEMSWTGGPEDPPPDALRLLRGTIRRATLERIAVLESTRQRLILRNDQGLSLGEIDDDVVTVAKGAKKGLRFRQIELEFDGHSTAEQAGYLTDAVVKRIRKAGARVEREQKFAKALGLGDSPISAALGHLGKRSTVRDLVQHSIANGLERLLDHDYRLRLDPADPPMHSVHQARVATRRLRSDLKTLGPILDPVWVSHTSSELRWLGDRLGQVRDADVLADRLRTDSAELPTVAGGAEEIQERLAEQRRGFSAELAEAINGDRYLKLLERLSSGAQLPPFYVDGHSLHELGQAPKPGDRARDVVPGLTLIPWKRLQKRVRKAGGNPSDKQLHQIRIAAKQLRYAAEAAAPVIGKPAERIARRAEDLQTVLGDHHDAVVAETWLQGVALDGSGVAGFTAGLLASTARRRQRRLRRQWRVVWERLAAKKSYGWIQQAKSHAGSREHGD